MAKKSLPPMSKGKGKMKSPPPGVGRGNYKETNPFPSKLQGGNSLQGGRDSEFKPGVTAEEVP